ncbi:SLT3 [Symbiodinium sp. CCMP2456]|nr:SLT3 [Symbiodinium sp. CCMP2456]
MPAVASRPSRQSFAVPYVDITRQLRERLPWCSIAFLALVGTLSSALAAGSPKPTCLGEKKLSYLVLDANLMVFFVTLVLNGAPVELTLLAAGAVACFAGLLEPGALFEGCASDAVVTLALLFPIMKAMGDTGIPETLIGYVLGKTKGLRPMLFLMFASVAFLSGFFNNTPIVVMMIPVLQSLCQRRGLPPRTLLMPLSFAAQAGGSLTLMGSSLNFVAQEVFAGKGYRIAFFTFSPGGAIIVFFGAVVTSLLGPRMLASSEGSSHSEGEPSASREASAKDHFTLLLRVQSTSPLIGVCIMDVGLHRIPGVQAIISLLRGGDGTSTHGPDSLSTIELQQFSDMLLQSMQEVSERLEYKGWDQLADLQLQEGDLLQIGCSAAGASAVRRVKGLELSNEAEVHLLGAQRRARSLCEVTIKDDLVGSKIDATRWRKELRCAVLSVKGAGQEESDPTRRPHPCSFHNYTLQAGDVLLVEAFRDMVGSDVWLDHFGVARVEPNSAPPRSGQKSDILRAAFIVLGLIVVISLASLGNKRLSMPLMSVIFLCCIIAVKGLKMEEAYGEVNGTVLLTIVGA